MNSCSSALAWVLLPMKLSSTMKTMSCHPRTRNCSSSATNCAGGLGARHAAIHDDDIAELAIERATPRKLHGHRNVMTQVDQVPARAGDARDLGPMDAE